MDKTKKKYSKLKILKTYLKKFGNRNKSVCWCLCKCGNYKEILLCSLKNGKTQSCGCLIKETVIKRNFKHGKSGKNNRLYRIWKAIKTRCLNKDAKNWEDYGGRGITICDEWKNNFLVFEEWALSNGYSEELSIDRIDNDGNYYPENCRWTDNITQANNKRVMKNSIYVTAFKETKTLTKWLKDKRCVVKNYYTLYSRIVECKQNPEKALTTKVKRKCNK